MDFFLITEGSHSDSDEYLYTDYSPLSGKNYNRLKEVNIDGTWEYSPVMEVTVDGTIT